MKGSNSKETGDGEETRCLPTPPPQSEVPSCGATPGIMLSDGGDGSSHRLISLSDSAALPPVTVCVNGGEPITLMGISQLEVRAFLVTARRQFLDVMNKADMRRQIEQPFFGFGRTLKAIKNTDSNFSGSVVFTGETRELLGAIVPSLPKYLVIKMMPHFLHPDNPDVGRYTRSKNPLHRSDPSNVEAVIMLKLRQLVLNRACPNILLLYKYMVVNDWHVVNNGMPIAALSGWITRSLKHPPSIRDSAVVMLMEHCRIGSLRGQAKASGLSTERWRSVLWQIFYTLAVLDREFPNFRHNDLHLGNILLQDTAANGDTPGCWRYEFDGATYHVPNAGLSARLSDFDWASADTFPNGKMAHVTVNPNFPPTTGRPVFDVHYLLNCVYSYANTPKSVRDFIRSLYPSSLRKAESTFVKKRRLVRGVLEEHPNLPVPADLLSHDWFSSYREGAPSGRIVLECYRYPAV